MKSSVLPVAALVLAAAAPAVPPAPAAKPVEKPNPVQNRAAAAKASAGTTTATPVVAAPARGTNPVAVLGVLDKRQGTTAEFTLKPGERFRFGRLSGILRTCDHTLPFEHPHSAAFVQVIDQPPALGGRPLPKPVVAFSGWLFAELPSLNPFVHPVYDVWLKSCTIQFPEGPSAPRTGTRTRARKSGDTPPASPAPTPPPAPSPAPAPAPTPEG